MLYPCDFLEPAQNVAVNGLGFASPLQFLKGFVAIVSFSLNVCSPLACLVLLRSPEGLPKYSPGAHLEQFPAPGSKMFRNTRSKHSVQRFPRASRNDQRDLIWSSFRLPTPKCSETLVLEHSAYKIPRASRNALQELIWSPVSGSRLQNVSKRSFWNILYIGSRGYPEIISRSSFGAVSGSRLQNALKHMF